MPKMKYHASINAGKPAEVSVSFAGDPTDRGNVVQVKVPPDLSRQEAYFLYTSLEDLLVAMGYDGLRKRG